MPNNPIASTGSNVQNRAVDSSKVLFSKGKNDECYTPLYGVIPILKHIPKWATVWCPFDKKGSQFVKQISKTNKVVFSHIDYGQDFYNYEPKEHWDVIISNPPFTNKKQIFERALSFNKPFALIMSNTWLNDSAPAKLFKDKSLELLMFDKRMRFETQQASNNKITFSSSYFCHDFLPEKLIFETLNTKIQVA